MAHRRRRRPILDGAEKAMAAADAAETIRNLGLIREQMFRITSGASVASTVVIGVGKVKWQNFPVGH